MKISMAAVLFFLMLIIIPAFHSQSRIPESVNQSANCCLKYQDKVLRRRLVKGYGKALHCHLPAIIFITKKNRQVCANPSDDWVQEYIQDPKLPMLPLGDLALVKSKKGQP